MKHTFIIFIVFWCLSAKAQFNEGTIFYKNSTESKGLIRIRTIDGIKFKKTKDSESISYDNRHILGFDTAGETYRYLQSQTGFSILLKEIIKGKMSLYSNEVTNPGHYIPNGFAGGGTGMPIGGGSATIYHILVDGELIRVGARWKNKHLEILKNCPSLIGKIKDKVLKKRDVYEIVDYYNHSCDG